RPFAAVRPVRVGVRVIDLEHDPVSADTVTTEIGQPVHVVDEASPEMLVEQLRRPRLLVDVLVPPVPLPGVVGALEEVREPADTSLGEDELQALVLLELAREQE